LKNYGFVLVWLIASNYIPGWFGDVRNPACVMPMLKANNYFAGITAIIALVWLTVFAGYSLQRLCGRNPLLIQEWLQKATLCATIVMLLTYFFLNTFWFYRTLWLW